MSDETKRWTIGSATITALVEAETPGIPPQLFFPTATNDDVRSVEWLADEAGIADPSGAITFRVQAFVVEMNGRTVLVDPCVGNGKQRSLPFWNDLATPWLDRFHAAGFTEDDIDTVVHTHLHEDHLGWDTQRVGDMWTPTFKRARHVYVGRIRTQIRSSRSSLRGSPMSWRRTQIWATVSACCRRRDTRRVTCR